MNPEISQSVLDKINEEAEKYAEETFKWPKNSKGEDMVQRVGQKPPFWRKHYNSVAPHYKAGRLKSIEEKDRAMKRASNIADSLITKLDCCKEDTIITDVIKHLEAIKQTLQF